MKNLFRRFFWLEVIRLFLAVLFPVVALGVLFSVVNLRIMREEIDRSFTASAEHAVYRLSAAAGDWSKDGDAPREIAEDAGREILEQNLRIPESRWQLATWVIDEEDRVLFENAHIDDLTGRSPKDFLRGKLEDVWTAKGMRKRRVVIDGKPYACATEWMPGFGWHFVRISPEQSLYEPVRYLLVILIAAVGGSVASSLLYAYQTARRKTRDIENLLDAIARAKQGQLSGDGEKPRGRCTTYSQTLQGMVDTFLQTEYLPVQQSDRRNHAKLLELQVLQAQLNPHFLFNTLSTIQWRAIALTGGRNGASDMIEYLSDILRFALDAGEKMATVREEIGILESYAAIQKIRYEERFEYACACEPGLEEKYVVKLLLQPLIENCFMHGLSADGGVLRVDIRLFAQEGQLCIRVADNGAGMDGAKLREVRESLTESAMERRGHIGLYNVNKRMKLIYGEEYGLQIDSAPGEGTTILLRLPLLDRAAAYALMNGRED